jgi:hypothetical protein
VQPRTPNLEQVQMIVLRPTAVYPFRNTGFGRKIVSFLTNFGSLRMLEAAVMFVDRIDYLFILSLIDG